MSAMGRKLTLGMDAERPPQLIVRDVPFKHPTGGFPNSEPAHVNAAYSVATAPAVEGKDVICPWTGGHIAKCDCRQREMAVRGDTGFDQGACRFFSLYWSRARRRSR